MASTTISSKKKNVQQRKPFTVERRSRTLKEFLNENSDSFSSSGFKSFPRQPCICNAHCFAKSDRLNSENTTRLLRSRSKAASTTISALQAVVKAVKKLQFNAVKSPSFLPRSLSRRLSRNNSGKQATEKKASDRELKITVTVKDIVRWASFRDLVEEKSRPLDFASSPHHCTTTTTTTTGSTSSTCSSSKSSSWCDSDFTSESLPSWSGTPEEYAENEVEVAKKHLPSVGKGCMEVTTETESYSTAVDLKVESSCDEKEQQSPVSVLDFKVGEDGEQFSSFTRSLANVERTRQNLLQKIQRFESLAKLESFDLEEWMPMGENTRYYEEVEEEEEEEEEEEPNELEKRATELLNHFRATSSVGMDKIKVEQLLLDFFSDELSASWRGHTKKDSNELDWKMVSMAKAWISGEQNGLYECGEENKIREACLRDMDSQKWSKFEEEKQELAMEVETQVLGCLVDEVLVDLFLH